MADTSKKALAHIAAALALLTAAGCGGDSSPAASGVSPTTSVAEASTTVTTAPASLDDWVAEQIAAGNTQASASLIEGADDAWIVLTHAPDQGARDGDARIMLADGSVLELPDELPSTSWPQLLAFGGTIAVVISDGTTLTGWALTPDQLEWVPLPSVSLERPRQGNFGAEVVGDVLLLTAQTIDQDANGYYVPAGLDGVLVSPTLEVTPMATPPDGVFTLFTSIIGAHGFILALDTGGGGNYPLTQPLEFDATANEWSPVPLPEWLACGSSCIWYDAHEFGDSTLEVVTPLGVVTQLPDHTVGLYDPDTRTWTQLPRPPFDSATPATAVVDGQVIVAPATSNSDDFAFGKVGVLDLATGEWAVTDFGNSGSEYTAQWWELRTNGQLVFIDLIEGGPEPASSADHVYDPATREWRDATEADAPLWQLLGGEFDISRLPELIA